MILKTDGHGNVGTCVPRSQATHTTVQGLNLQAHDAVFNQTNPPLKFMATEMNAKNTSVAPISLYRKDRLKGRQME